MHENLNINVHHMARVEGHGNIVLNMKDGTIEDLRLDIVESPRFFEAFVVGRHYRDVPHVTSRICGICSVGHTMASVRAVENALGMEVSENVKKIRKLLHDAAFLQSHVLHAYFLVAPDVLGVGSVIPLAESHPDVVKMALRMKKFTNDVCDALGGRTVHPINVIPGGLARFPTKKELIELKAYYEKMLPDFETTYEVFSSLDYPDWFAGFDRPTEYISLHKPDGEYPLYDGQVISSTGRIIDEQDYLSMIHERVESHAAAKHVSGETDTYMASALARYNNNYDQLRPKAKEVAVKLGMGHPCTNTFANTFAQVVECAHLMEEDLAVLTELIENTPEPEAPVEPTKFGRGAAAVEVPRGILFHEYTFGEDGILTDANCIIPTGQNLANIEADMQKLVPGILDRSKEEITLSLECLVRAYDPCISCATHFLEVDFRE
ncbi:Ni/Fe hydrogenase subunit alpha [bacterium]|nr:Ni/Fe hydrogenase subunit alpha [bacterium]